MRRQSKNKTGLVGSIHVDYQKLYRVFQCMNPECKQYIEVPEDELDFNNIDKNKIICEKCGFSHDISLDASFINGYFERFLERIPIWKYCRVCCSCKPIASFDSHSRMPSGHQMECKVCKWHINSILNPKRTRDQLREGGEGRRLLEVFRGEDRIKLDEKELLKKFHNKCFKCGTNLVNAKRGEYHVDHVLPAKYLWQLSDAAAPLCQKCNLEKRDMWPGRFYTSDQLKDLSLRTGVNYDTLADEKPRINPTALQKLKEKVDEIYKELSDRPREMRKLRSLVLSIEDIDILDYLKDYRKDEVLKIIENV